MIKITRILDAEQHLDGIELVVFDLDDTLYSEKDYVRSGYRKVAAYFNRPELANRMWEVFEQGGKAIDAALEEAGLADQKEQALRIYREQDPDIQLYPGVSELLDRLRREKKVGVITDGRPEGQRAKLRALGIQVDQVIVTDELGGLAYRKPNQTAFRLMQQALNVPFPRMAYIGDNPRKDFIAPEALGMRSIYFQNPDGLYSK